LYEKNRKISGSNQICSLTLRKLLQTKKKIKVANNQEPTYETTRIWLAGG